MTPSVMMMTMLMMISRLFCWRACFTDTCGSSAEFRRLRRGSYIRARKDCDNSEMISVDEIQSCWKVKATVTITPFDQIPSKGNGPKKWWRLRVISDSSLGDQPDSTMLLSPMAILSMQLQHRLKSSNMETRDGQHSMCGQGLHQCYLIQVTLFCDEQWVLRCLCLESIYSCLFCQGG